MKKEFMEPEVEVVEFEAKEEIAYDPSKVTSDGWIDDGWH